MLGLRGNLAASKVGGDDDPFDAGSSHDGLAPCLICKTCVAQRVDSCGFTDIYIYCKFHNNKAPKYHETRRNCTVLYSPKHVRTIRCVPNRYQLISTEGFRGKMSTQPISLLPCNLPLCLPSAQHHLRPWHQLDWPWS